jgi:hypothetical protein
MWNPKASGYQRWPPLQKTCIRPQARYIRLSYGKEEGVPWRLDCVQNANQEGSDKQDIAFRTTESLEPTRLKANAPTAHFRSSILRKVIKESMEYILAVQHAPCRQNPVVAIVEPQVTPQGKATPPSAGYIRIRPVHHMQPTPGRWFPFGGWMLLQMAGSVNGRQWTGLEQSCHI